MLFCADIGNTTISLGVFEGEQLRFTSRIAAARERSVDEYAITLQAIFRMYGTDPKKVEGAALSSVVKPLSPVFAAAVEKVCGVPSLLLGPGVRTGLNIKIDSPAQLGADLAANCVAAQALVPPPLAVLDLGTATTLTVIDGKGVLTGVMICPGVQSGLEALSDLAAELPAISLEEPKALLGKNTVDSMNSGVIFGAAAMVDGLLARISEQCRGEDLSVVVTGGLAETILPYCRTKMLSEPNLALLGLKRVFELNRRKHAAVSTS